MNRREFAGVIGLASLGLTTTAKAADRGAAGRQTPEDARTRSREDAPKFAMLIYPGMVALDLVGPMTALNLTGGTIDLVWKNREPVANDLGLPIAATCDFASCPRDVDAFVVPGGLGGTTTLLDDAESLDFIREMSGSACYVTAICTGTLLLGAAGVLKGKRATSHWYCLDMLALFGATPVKERVVEDGNVITGNGTGSLDFGLTLSARIRGEEWARRSQLVLEYDPQPPFHSGSPADAGTALTAEIMKRREPALDATREAAKAAATRLEL